MVDRRAFIAMTAAAAAGTLVGQACGDSASAAGGNGNLNQDLTGMWHDPWLREPTAILITSDAGGADVRVAGQYEHSEFGAATFHGTGTFSGNTLAVDYEHHLNQNLGQGVLTMTLARLGHILVLQGEARSTTSDWYAPEMLWYKCRH